MNSPGVDPEIPERGGRAHTVPLESRLVKYKEKREGCSSSSPYRAQIRPLSQPTGGEKKLKEYVLVAEKQVLFNNNHNDDDKVFVCVIKWFSRESR